MDPMQIQNQQNMGIQQPQQQVPIQYVNQGIPQQMQQMPQQQAQPAVQEDGVFDKILKGIVDFIAKMAAPAPVTNNTAVQQPMNGQPMMNGQQQVQQNFQQPMPGANFFNNIGNTLDNIGNQAGQMIQNGASNVIQGTQNYVAEQPTVPVNTQQLLTQNYQPNVLQQPVATNQPVIQQPQAPQQPDTNPVPQAIQQPSMPDVVVQPNTNKDPQQISNTPIN